MYMERQSGSPPLPSTPPPAGSDPGRGSLQSNTCEAYANSLTPETQASASPPLFTSLSGTHHGKPTFKSKATELPGLVSFPSVTVPFPPTSYMAQVPQGPLSLALGSTGGAGKAEPAGNSSAVVTRHALGIFSSGFTC